MKKDIDEMLRDKLLALGLIDEHFTGKMIINFNQGGVTDVERAEFIVMNPDDK